jgi:2-polyprenyl-3-methyl-5-hydroxy-6-metoxy-1,4-benzoquinol methylase
VRDTARSRCLLASRSVLPSESKGTVRMGPRLATVGSCPICGRRDSEVLFRSPDWLYGVPGEFTYRQCISCQTVYQDPRVVADDIPLCYPGGYYTHAASDVAVGTQDDKHVSERRLGQVREWMREGIVRAVFQPRNVPWWRGGPGALLARIRGLRERAFFGLLDELIPREAGAARALDVGCGAGRLIAELARVGWTVEGLESDPMAAEVARRTSGCAVTVGNLLTTDLPTGAFDLIVLSHVFEHLNEPEVALRRLGGLLTPAGRAVLIYPNPMGLGARLFQRSWTEWDPPRHLVMPPLPAICAAARRNGLRPLSGRTVTRSTRAFAWSRSHRAGLTPVDAQEGRGDKTLKTLANLMVCLGLRFGEEIVVSLGRQVRDSGVRS